jgi:hypothetical protein
VTPREAPVLAPEARGGGERGNRGDEWVGPALFARRTGDYEVAWLRVGADGPLQREVIDLERHGIRSHEVRSVLDSKMQMRSCRVAGVAQSCDRLPCPYTLAWLDKDRASFKVHVGSVQAGADLLDDLVATESPSVCARLDCRSLTRPEAPRACR